MAFDAGAITAKMSLDSTGFTGGMAEAARSATAVSSRITATLTEETAKQQKVLATATASAGNSGMAELRSLAQRQTAAAQRLRTAAQADQFRAATNQATDPIVRAGMAATIKGMREEARRANVGEEIQRRMLGTTETAKKIAGENLKAAASVAGGVATAGGAGYGGVLSELQGDFGKKSLLGKTLKLIQGGGAIGALAMGSGMLNQLSKQVEEMSLAYVRGKTTAAELSGEILKSIPIVGAAGEGLARFWGLASGETFRVDHIYQEAEAIDAVTDAMKQSNAVIQETSKSLGRYIEEMDRTMQRMNLSGLDLNVFDANDARDKRSREIDQMTAAGKTSEAYKRLVKDQQVAKDWSKSQDEIYRKAQIISAGQSDDMGSSMGGDENYIAWAKEEALKASTWLTRVNKAVEAADADLKSKAGEARMKSEQIKEGDILDAEWEDYWNEYDKTVLAPLSRVGEQMKLRAEAVRGLKVELARANLTDAQRRIEEARDRGGNEAAGVQRQIEDANQVRQQAADATAYMESLQTPKQAYDEMVAKLTQWRNTNDAAGKPLLEQKDYEAALAAEKAKLDGVMNRDRNQEARLGAAVQYGSADFMRAIYSNKREPLGQKIDQSNAYLKAIAGTKDEVPVPVEIGGPANA